MSASERHPLTGLGPAPDAAVPAAAARPAGTQVRLWDLPLRVFHWGLLAAVAAAIVSGELGGNAMVWHGRAGVAVAGLLVFRLIWGVVGPEPARFAHFAPSPARLRAYLAGTWRGIGHNPLGALSVFALLGVLAVQVATGLVGNDDIAFTGPLARFVDESLSSRLTGWHKRLAWGLFALLALHVTAIAFYAVVRKDRLVPPMVTGWRTLPAGVATPRVRVRARALGLAVLPALAAFAWLLWLG